MIRYLFLCSLLLLFAEPCPAQAWQKTEGKISTPWAEQVNSTSPLPEYPRPQMVRKNWLNLNGLWSYSILPLSGKAPSAYEGKILVPFAIESSLSGVGKSVGKENRLWYHREVSLPPSFKNKNVLLHFGAVDWQCDVYVNEKKVGDHQGGYDPFTINITSILNRASQFTLTVGVWDPSDEGPQPRGKQVKEPHSIWYTPVTGIWQTVWLEAVPASYIESLKITPDVDAQTISVSAIYQNQKPGDQLRVTALDGMSQAGEEVSETASAKIKIQNPKLWSPAHPFLYDLKVTLLRKEADVS